MDRVIQIDKQDKIINTDFGIKQIKVHNPSQYPLYINFNGKKPTTIVYDFLVQPHSDVTSPKIDTRIFTTYTSIIDLNAVAEITAYSDMQSSPANMPFVSAQTIGSLPNYPVTITNTSGFLPNILVNEFKTIYFLVNMGNNRNFPIILNQQNSTVGFGGLDGMGGIITLVPNKLNSTYSVAYNIYVPSGYTMTQDIVINAVQSDALLYINPVSGDLVSNFSHIVTNTYDNVYIAKPPGFLLSYYVYSANSLAFNYDLTVEIILDLDVTYGVRTHTVFTRNFVGAIGAGITNIPYLFKDMFVPVSDALCFVDIRVTDNLPMIPGLGQLQYVNKWDFVP